MRHCNSSLIIATTQIYCDYDELRMPVHIRYVAPKYRYVFYNI